jgi:hypothetical protein
MAAALGYAMLSPVDFDFEEVAMFSNLQFRSMILVPVCFAVWAMTNSASAITVEVAKKCEGLATKVFPPREIGNPAAGSAKGSSQDRRNYFNKCVANGGNMDNDAQGKK